MCDLSPCGAGFNLGPITELQASDFADLRVDVHCSNHHNSGAIDQPVDGGQMKREGTAFIKPPKSVKRKRPVEGRFEALTALICRLQDANVPS